MLDFMKTYFPKLLTFIVAILIFVGVLPKDYDPFKEPETSVIVITEPETEPSEETTTVEIVPSVPEDPSTWSIQQIVSYYKQAAAKTTENGCTSHSQMECVSLEGAPAIAKTPVVNAINSNKEDRAGVTGGYQNLQADDLQLATARKDGNKIILTLIPKDQTDGVNGREGEGTVGHLVYVVNGVDQILSKANLKGNFPEGSVRFEYKYAYANNIIINTDTGLIESGEWGYDVYAYLNGCSVSGFTLKNIKAIIKYTVTLV